LVASHNASAATVYQRSRPVAGASLFLAPGALSGLMRPPTQPSQERTQLKAHWLKQRTSSNRKGEDSKARKGSTAVRQKTARFAEGELLETVRQSPNLEKYADFGRSLFCCVSGNVSFRVFVLMFSLE